MVSKVFSMAFQDFLGFFYRVAWIKEMGGSLGCYAGWRVGGAVWQGNARQANARQCKGRERRRVDNVQCAKRIQINRQMMLLFDCT